VDKWSRLSTDSSAPASEAGADARSQRDPSLDIFRGIAISEVLLHHVTAIAMRKTAIGTLSHDLFAILNRTLHFAVPAFLFIMAVLLTRTMVGKSRSWREFYERRARQTLVPYLIWSGIYIAFRAMALPQHHPPEVLLDPDRWRVWLLWGKAWYHLYFMVLALQLYLVFPLILWTLRRSRVRLGALLVLGLAAQLVAHWVHARWIRSPFPSTLLLWHVVPVLTGVWVGLYLEKWDSVWKRIRPVAIPLMVLGWAVYLPNGYAKIHGAPVNSHVYHFSYWAYTTGVAFCLLALCRGLQRRNRRLARGFQFLGTYSIQIYLVHPMMLHFWSMMPQHGGTLRFHCTTIMVTLTVLGVSLLIARLAARTVGGEILFGRGDRRARA
jgi:peptidoglycan/LPS O-acetylase OafA/YrhL